jgi:hypothetical protein
MQTIQLNGQLYEIPTKQASAISSAIAYAFTQCGCPDTPLSDAGEKVMDVIIATWRDTYPKLSDEWFEERQLTRNEQMSTQDQVRKGTGRQLASYPMYIYEVMRKLWPKFKATERDNAIAMVRRYPIFSLVERKHI